MRPLRGSVAANDPTPDEIDLRILRRIQRDARISNVDLAEAASLSPAPCLRRVKALEEHGVITAYVAQLDGDKVGYGMQVFINVTLEHQTTRTVAVFEKAITTMPEVLECHLVAGEADYLIKVVVPNLEAYQKFVVEKIGAIPGIANIRSLIPLKRVKSNGLLPI